MTWQEAETKMKWWASYCRRIAVITALLLAFGGADDALAAVSESQAAESVAASYDVEVLRVRAGEVDGRPVWLVTVMNKGGDFNEAFQVTTLAVDQESGELVPAFQHGASGYSLPSGNSSRPGSEINPLQQRHGIWR